jgi:hypothetical protein
MVVLAVSGWANAASSTVIVYGDGDRLEFESTLARFLVDDYSDHLYTIGDIGDGPVHDRFSDSAMSAVKGETVYTTTFPNVPDLNRIVNQEYNPYYCVGCNGSFTLGFMSTSYGNERGVYGVGFDIVLNPGPGSNGFDALVTFGDGSIANYDLPLTVFDFSNTDLVFFGITSETLIKTIDFGPYGGSITSSRFFALDNLTIGSVPTPATLALFGIGLAGLGWSRRKKS